MNRQVAVYVVEAVLVTGVWAWVFGNIGYPLADWTWALMIMYGAVLVVNRFMGYPLGWAAQQLKMDLSADGADPSFSTALFVSMVMLNGGLIHLLANLGFQVFGLDTTADTYISLSVFFIGIGLLGLAGCFTGTRFQPVKLGSGLLQAIFGLRPQRTPAYRD
jgi:hypothetical protein